MARADDFAPDELRNNFRGWPQAVQKANREIPTHRANASAPMSPRLAIHPMMNAVGGTTLHYWAQSWRLNPWDFKVVSETTRRYGASRIPKGSTVEDWPFGLEELEPYYDKVEYEIGVSGQAGNIKGKIDPRGNTFEGARAREYPMPPLRGNQLHRHDGGCRAQARMASVPRTRCGDDARVSRSRRLRVSRLLLAGRLSHQRQGIDGGHHDPQSAGDRSGCRW